MPQAAAPPRPRVVCKRSEPSGGGTASMPVREKGRRRPGSPPARPFSRPQPPADRRQSAGFSPMASGFTAETDWLLEESGFELSVPPKIGIVWCFASSASRGAADEAVVKSRLLGQPGPDMPVVRSSLLDPQEGVLGSVRSIHMLLGGFTV